MSRSERANPGLKLIDRYAGIPAVAALGSVRMLRGRRRVPEEWTSVGLLKGAAIGDVVLLSAIVADLRAARPDVHIQLFAGSSNIAFARLIDGVDSVVQLPVTRVIDAARQLRAADLDVLIDFGQWARLESVLAAAARARCTIGFATPGQFRHAAFDVAVGHRRTVHELDNFRALLEPLGVETGSRPRLPVAPVGPPSQRPYAVLHVWPGGANAAERSWPPRRWRSLARALAGQGLELILTGGPGDVPATESLVAGWRDEGLPARSVAGEEAARTLVWLAHAAGVVSVNTGLMHAAAAVGAPVVALNGPTSGRRWGPVGERARSVASPVVPDGYLHLGFERDDRYARCMEAIEVEAVLAAWADVTGSGEVPDPGRRCRPRP